MLQRSVINNGVAGQAGLDPAKDPIFLEDPNNENAKPYINILQVVRRIKMIQH